MLGEKHGERRSLGRPTQKVERHPNARRFLKRHLLLPWAAVHKTRGKIQAEVKRALEKDIAYQTGRVLRRNFPRRRDLAYYFSERWETNLGDIGPGRFVDLKSQREIGRYFLLVIDVFSKKVFARGLADKKGATVGAAFWDIIAKLEPPYTLPLVLESDQGKKYVNKPFLDYLKRNAVQAEWERGGNKARRGRPNARCAPSRRCSFLIWRRAAALRGIRPCAPWWIA